MRDMTLQQEMAALLTVQSRMRELLVGVAEALKGPTNPRAPHDWADLPEIAAKIATEHRHLKAWWQEHLQQAGRSFEELAVDMAAVRTEATAEGFRQGARAMWEALQSRALLSNGEAAALAAAEVQTPDEVI